MTLLAAAGCSDRGQDLAPETPVPALTVLVPDSGAVGDTISARGENLGAAQGASEIRFGSLAAATTAWSDTAILALVPTGAASGSVRAIVEGVETNPLPFRVLGAPPPPAVLDSLIPVRTVVGDTVRIAGSGFGASPDGRAVAFASARRSPLAGPASVVAPVVSWSDAEVAVLVPAGAVDGDVHVEGDGEPSNGLFFSVAPQLVSYAADVTPLWDNNGCTACHVGMFPINGFRITTYAELMEGTSLHGPAVRPRRAEASMLVEVLAGGFPSVERMPQGGPYLDSAEMLLVKDWIDQGARDN